MVLSNSASQSTQSRATPCTKYPIRKLNASQEIQNFSFHRRNGFEPKNILKWQKQKKKIWKGFISRESSSLVYFIQNNNNNKKKNASTPLVRSGKGCAIIKFRFLFSGYWYHRRKPDTSREHSWNGNPLCKKCNIWSRISSKPNIQEFIYFRKVSLK